MTVNVTCLHVVFVQLVHEELALQWVVSSGPTRDLTLVNSWFFFELIVRESQFF